MKIGLIIINMACLLGSLIWLVVDKSWEPLITFLGLIGSLITLCYSNTNSEAGIKMRQKGGNNSKNYQSSGDITINK